MMQFYLGKYRDRYRRQRYRHLANHKAVQVSRCDLLAAETAPALDVGLPNFTFAKAFCMNQRRAILFLWLDPTAF